MEGRVITDADIESLGQELITLASKQGDQEYITPSWQELVQAANHFIDSYSVLQFTYEHQKMQILKNITQGVSDPNQFFKLGSNIDLIFTRSKFLLAFAFDEKLVAFREKIPKKAVFVYEDKKTGSLKTVEMSMMELVQYIDKRNRIYQNLGLLKADERKALEDSKFQNSELQKHASQVQKAYSGINNRLNRFYEIANTRQKQGGLLMWKMNHEWILAKIANLGDVKEAYVAALMAEHKSSLDVLCRVPAGSPDYYSHDLIAAFFSNYIYEVTNRPAIIEEDVITKNFQYGVKSNKAEAPSFQQYLDSALLIKNQSKALTKEELEVELYKNFDKNVHRNTMVAIDEKFKDSLFRDLAKTFKR